MSRVTMTGAAGAASQKSRIAFLDGAKHRPEGVRGMDAPNHHGATQKAPAANAAGAFCVAPDDDLLSHGETPHYHRR